MGASKETPVCSVEGLVSLPVMGASKETPVCSVEGVDVFVSKECCRGNVCSERVDSAAGNEGNTCLQCRLIDFAAGNGCAEGDAC